MLLIAPILQIRQDVNILFCCSCRWSGEHLDAQKAFPKSHLASDDEDNARMSIVLSSAALSALLMPSVKEVC